jgi:hypothetical protein
MNLLKLVFAWRRLEQLDVRWWPEVGRRFDGSWYCEICLGGKTPSEVGPPTWAIAPTPHEAINRALDIVEP